MNKLWVSLIYIGFFALIGASIYFTKSALPLFALLLAPSYNEKDE